MHGHRTVVSVVTVLVPAERVAVVVTATSGGSNSGSRGDGRHKRSELQTLPDSNGARRLCLCEPHGGSSPHPVPGTDAWRPLGFTPTFCRTEGRG